MSEQGKNTPGPWLVVPGTPLMFGGSDAIIAEGIDDAVVCMMGHDMPEVDANARLIAAAPELLGACQAAIAYDKAIRGRAQAGDFEKLDPRGAIAEGVDLDTLYEEWITLSMCAIAKAEGRP